MQNPSKGEVLSAYQGRIKGRTKGGWHVVENVYKTQKAGVDVSDIIAELCWVLAYGLNRERLRWIEQFSEQSRLMFRVCPFPN